MMSSVLVSRGLPACGDGRLTGLVAEDSSDVEEQEGEQRPGTTTLDILTFGEEGGPPLTRPCVDCGLITGNYCDGDELGRFQTNGFACLGEIRLPHGDAVHRAWNEGQRTPLCSFCDRKRGACHFCLKTTWVTQNILYCYC